jgi:hypothetical protein
MKTDLRQVEWEHVDWISLCYSDQWWDLLNTVMNITVPHDAGNFLTVRRTVSWMDPVPSNYLSSAKDVKFYFLAL